MSVYLIDLKRESDKRLSNHFMASEFACPHCKVVKVNPELLIKLELLRRKMGGLPLKITSGYRCPEYNVQIGGYFKSQHTLGNAADVRPLKRSSYDYVDLVKAAIELFPRVGVYKERFVHVDLHDPAPYEKLYWYRDNKGQYHYFTESADEILAMAFKFEKVYSSKYRKKKKKSSGDG